MSAIEPNWQALLVFLLGWLIGCVGLFYLSGNLPVRAAPQHVQTGLGPVLVWINLAVLILLATMTLVFAIGALRWTSIVVGGGLVFLFAPFIVQDLPRGLKDTQAGLAALLMCAVLAVSIVYMAS